MADARFLAIELHNQKLLVDAQLVREVIGDCSIVEVPHVSGSLRGIFLWHGKAIPLLQWQPSNTSDNPAESDTLTRRRRTLIFHALGEWAGILVDDATEILNIDEAQLLPVRHNPIPFARYEVDDGTVIRSVIDLSDLLAHVLDVSARGNEEPRGNRPLDGGLP